MKNRIRFNNLVVSAEELPAIKRIVRHLSECAPSDAFISVDFHKANLGFQGRLQLNSPSENFSEEANGELLLSLMHSLEDLTMRRIVEWREKRFSVIEEEEKLTS